MHLPSRRELLQRGTQAALAAATALVPETASALDPPARAGGPRFKVGSCAYSYRQYLQSKTSPMTLLDFLDVCAGWNIDGVELTSYYFPEPLTAATVHKIARRAFLLGLEVAGTAMGGSLCFPAGPQRDKSVQQVREWIRRAVDMGAPCLRVFAGAPPKGTEMAIGRKWVVEALEEVLPAAEEHGVMLAMENHGGVVGDADGVLEIVQAIKSDWFGVKWDSGNFRTPDPFKDLSRTARYAVTTHIKTEMGPAGMRPVTADLPRVLSVLREAGYRGYLLLEYEGAEEPKIAVPRTLATLQQLAVAKAAAG